MYGALWRHLPGGRVTKAAGALTLLVIALLVLFVVVFPFVEPRLPFSDVTVDPAGPVPTRS